MVYSDVYSEGHQGGVTLVLNGQIYKKILIVVPTQSIIFKIRLYYLKTGPPQTERPCIIEPTNDTLTGLCFTVFWNAATYQQPNRSADGAQD